MRKSVLTLCLFALLSLSTALASTLVSVQFESEVLGRDWNYTVYLPSGYDYSGLSYPVVYLLHGNGGNENSWPTQGNVQEVADTLIRDERIPPVIIVMPEANTTWYVDRKENMETAVIEELIPEIESQFRTIPTREGRVVAGLSMGGYGALRFALIYPEMFAAAGLLSPAIYVPEPPEDSSARRVGVFGEEDYDPEVWTSLNYPNYIDAFLAQDLDVPMYINSGDDDEFFIERHAAELYSLLREAGEPAELRILDGAHEWSVWASTIGEALEYTLANVSRPRLELEEAATDN